MDKTTSSNYMAARNAAIQQVDIAFYGENFPERLRNLWARLKSEPEIVADYRDIWFLPQVVSHYGNKHLATMQELLSEVENYSVKEKASSGGGVGFWSD